MKYKKPGNSRRSTKLKKQEPELHSFADHLDSQYGKRGTIRRERYESGFEAFRLGAMLGDLRQRKGLTQQALASRCGTTRHYISRIENDASDIRLSTLMRIINDGFGGKIIMNIAW